MSRRQMQIMRLILAVGFAGLAAWAFADANYAMGVIYTIFTVAWVLIALFADRLTAMRDRRGA